MCWWSLLSVLKQRVPDHICTMFPVQSQAEGIVDLSARADLTSPANQQQAPTPTPSKRKKGAKGDAEAGSEGGSCGGVVSEGQWPCPPGSVQEAVVEVVQGPPAHYAVVSLPQVQGWITRCRVLMLSLLAHFYCGACGLCVCASLPQLGMYRDMLIAADTCSANTPCTWCSS
eukprot:1037664-Pelagomonas_calceolata.AAC.7